MNKRHSAYLIHRREQLKWGSCSSSYLLVPPQIKGGRVQAGVCETDSQVQVLGRLFPEGPLDMHLTTAVMPSLVLGIVLIHLAIRSCCKLLQTVAAVLQVSSEADLLFVSPMKKIIYLTLLWLLISLYVSSFARCAIAFLQWLLSIPRCSELWYCMQ